MSVTLTINGVQFEYPETGDQDWGSNATNWASAVTTGMLQKAGGNFYLTAEVDFGPNYGIKAHYFRAEGPGPDAESGGLRLSNTEAVAWRNFEDTNDCFITVNTSNELTYQNGSGSPEVIVAGLIVNADVDPSAAIAFSKMAALSASVAAVTDGSGVITTSATTATQIGYLSTTTSDVQTQLTGRLQLAGGTMTGTLTLAANPVSILEAATKQYVDSVAMGLQVHNPVRIATTANGTLATAFANGQTIDGVTIATNDRILIKNQSTQADNGIYVVQASGAPVRATDADTWAELVSAYVFVTAGTANAGSSWVCTVAAGGTLGVTAVTFGQFSASGTYTASGTGITLTGSQFDLQLDGGTLSQSGSGVKVATGALTNTQINASAAIALSKLATVTASRALVSDGSGFVSASSVTSTTLAFLDATSSVQTQLDAKIASSVMTTNNDMIYRAAGVPARLAAGTSGYVLESNSGVPTWTDPKISTTYFVSSASTYAVLSTYTALTLVAVTDSIGSPCVRSTDNFTFPYTGKYEVTLYLSGISTTGANRKIMCRLRNTTDSTTLDVSCSANLDQGSGSVVLFLRGNVTDIAKSYQIQLAASGTGVSINVDTINSVSSNLYQLKIDRPRQ